MRELRVSKGVCEIICGKKTNLSHRVLQKEDGSSVPVIVWTSTLQRTIQTAERLPFPKLRWKVLDEIQAGIFDGWTYAEIEKHRPEEFAARKRDKLSYRFALDTSLMNMDYDLVVCTLPRALLWVVGGQRKQAQLCLCCKMYC